MGALVKGACKDTCVHEHASVFCGATTVLELAQRERLPDHCTLLRVACWASRWGCADRADRWRMWAAAAAASAAAADASAAAAAPHAADAASNTAAAPYAAAAPLDAAATDDHNPADVSHAAAEAADVSHAAREELQGSGGQPAAVAGARASRGAPQVCL